MTREWRIACAAALFCFGMPAQTPANLKTPIRGAVNGRQFLVDSPNRNVLTAEFIKIHGRPPAAQDEELLRPLGEARICSTLRQQIRFSVAENVRQGFGISVDPKDALAAQSQYFQSPGFSKQLETQRNFARILLAALEDVYVRGRDPKEVYKTQLAPAGYPEPAWIANLEVGRTAEGREKLAWPLRTTDADMQRPSPNVVKIMEKQRLDNAVDAEISKQDPVFRQYLAEWESKRTSVTPLSYQVRGMNEEHRRYLERSREEWWRSRTAESVVELADRTLFTGCGLAEIGVRIPPDAR